MRAIGLVAAALLRVVTVPALAQDKESHLHIARVLDAWIDTSDGLGLLPTAQAETEIALQHVALALESSDLMDIQLHIGYVAHALNPEVEANGSGLGYGVVKAAHGVAAHNGFSAASDDAWDNVRGHAVHVSTSAGNVVGWAEAALKCAARVGSSPRPTARRLRVTPVRLRSCCAKSSTALTPTRTAASVGRRARATSPRPSTTWALC